MFARDDFPVSARKLTLAPRAPNSHVSHMSEPRLVVRKAPHAPVRSAWAIFEGNSSEEIFEAASEEEAVNWIETADGAWLEERRRKRLT